MTALVDFYRGDATDVEGRMLSEMWTWSDDDLETSHDFIQWMFPTSEASRYNPDAPLLSDACIAAFRNDPQLRNNLRHSFSRILSFLGFARSDSGAVIEGPQFSGRIPDVWAAPNHNWLRITRILRSLCTLGLETEAHQLYDRLEQLYSSRRYPITAETFEYWTEAVRAQDSCKQRDDQ